MNIEVIVIGNLKEKYWRDAVAEYTKRLGRYCKLQITELKEVALPDNASDANINQVLDKEAEQILKKIDDRSHVIALAIDGKQMTSEAFSKKMAEYQQIGKKIVFIIGSSHGISDMIYRRTQEKLSFSNMTFPHQMARVILLEQIYRGFRILLNEPYHK